MATLSSHSTAAPRRLPRTRSCSVSNGPRLERLRSAASSVGIQPVDQPLRAHRRQPGWLNCSDGAAA